MRHKIENIFNKFAKALFPEKTEFEQRVHATKKLYGMDNVKAFETVIQEEIMFLEYDNNQP